MRLFILSMLAFVVPTLAGGPDGNAAPDERGSLCLCPLPAEKPTTSAPDLACSSANYTFKIDAGEMKIWPRAEPLKISSLDLEAKHKVRIFCDGKPHQTFGIRFSEYDTHDLSLSINDMYQTAQLWPPNHFRWCICR